MFSFPPLSISFSSPKKDPTKTSSSFHEVAAFSVARSLYPREPPKRHIYKQLLGHSKREWFVNPEVMEGNSRNSHANDKRPLKASTSANEVKKPAESNTSNSTFVNHGAMVWQQNRRSWVRDKSQRPKRMAKDPVISWSATYEDLLSTADPFPEPIPLAEMVDFLVDIWHGEDLHD